MLTWGAFNIIGAPQESRDMLTRERQDLLNHVKAEIDKLGVESDGSGWRTKAFLYCVEAKCPQSGWAVPLLPSRVVGTSRSAIAELVQTPPISVTTFGFAAASVTKR